MNLLTMNKVNHSIGEMETLQQGHWDAVVMADYCWYLKRNVPSAFHYDAQKSLILLIKLHYSNYS